MPSPRALPRGPCSRAPLPAGLRYIHPGGSDPQGELRRGLPPPPALASPVLCQAGRVQTRGLAGGVMGALRQGLVCRLGGEEDGWVTVPLPGLGPTHVPGLAVRRAEQSLA